MSSPSFPQPDAPYDSITQKARDALFREAVLYLNQEELILLEKACAYAFHAHDGQLRKSGEPYITHPIAVTLELARWRMDVETLCAGLMHDVLEDTPITAKQMSESFGRTITQMVQSLTKLEAEEKKTDKSELQASNLRRLVVSMLNEPRVIVVKLSDRLHNMRTIGAQRAESKIRSATETFNVYAPIADLLGLNKVYCELQDLSFEAMYPMRYRVLKRSMQAFWQYRKTFIEGFIDNMRNLLAQHNIHATVYGRERNLYSIYQKHKDSKQGRFKDMRDVFAFRVIVNNIDECYLALGILHRNFPPQLDKFKDYIALPKSNGYQSLHTSLRVTNAMHPLKVQIRTKEMHSKAETGFVSDIAAGKSANVRHIQTLLEEIRELNEGSSSDREFMENITADFGSKFFAYTPKAKAIALVRGATPIDFAYAIHSEIGDQCSGARVNRKKVPLNTRLNSGDMVEILTSPTAHPKPEWLTMAKMGYTRSRIRAYFNRISRQDALVLGERIFHHVLHNIAQKYQLNETELTEKFQQTYLTDERTWDKVYDEIARVHYTPLKVALDLLALFKEQPEKHEWSDWQIGTQINSHIHLASCCHPVPKDDIRVLFSQESGFVVHREECPQLLNKNNEKNTLKASWQDLPHDSNQRYVSHLKLTVEDKQGLLLNILGIVSQKRINLASIVTEDMGGGFKNIILSLEVRHLDELNEVIKGLQQVHRISEIHRL